jgi:hypothetical protein
MRALSLAIVAQISQLTVTGRNLAINATGRKRPIADLRGLLPKPCFAVFRRNRESARNENGPSNCFSLKVPRLAWPRPLMRME